MPYMQPAKFGADVRVFHKQIRNVANAAACPIAQRKERLASDVIGFLDQVA